jgi:hypothetical protein
MAACSHQVVQQTLSELLNRQIRRKITRWHRLLTILTVYELASSNLLGARWNVWATRKDRPKPYCSLLAIQAAFILFVAYVFLLP